LNAIDAIESAAENVARAQEDFSNLNIKDNGIFAHTSIQYTGTSYHNEIQFNTLNYFLYSSIILPL